MQIISSIKQLRRVIDQFKSANKSIGFVPTMGALHAGHLSLTSYAAKENDVTIVSIFVNPTQFNDTEDLKKYPRTIEADATLLEENDIDILFYPSVKEIYPSGRTESFDYNFGGLEHELEGKHRPGHFQGVGQVVKRLLEITTPDRLYMGQKDFQQFSLINYMIKDLSIPVILRIAPIIREADGLAMSSRNIRLSIQDRSQAPIIYNTLKETQLYHHAFSVQELQHSAQAKLSSFKNFNVEYYSISDGNTLKDISDMEHHDYVVASTAVWVGDVRLIDNIIIKNYLSSDLLII